MPLKSLGESKVFELAEIGGQQVQHTVHELEPLTRYSVRVLAVNALGRSKPSVALSLRTSEEGELHIAI